MKGLTFVGQLHLLLDCLIISPGAAAEAVTDSRKEGCRLVPRQRAVERLKMVAEKNVLLLLNQQTTKKAKKLFWLSTSAAHKNLPVFRLGPFSPQPTTACHVNTRSTRSFSCGWLWFSPKKVRWFYFKAFKLEPQTFPTEAGKKCCRRSRRSPLEHAVFDFCDDPDHPSSLDRQITRDLLDLIICHESISLKGKTNFLNNKTLFCLFCLHEDDEMNLSLLTIQILKLIFCCIQRHDKRRDIKALSAPSAAPLCFMRTWNLIKHI